MCAMPLGGRALVAQQPQVPVGRAERVADPPEREQAGIRVGLSANQPSMTGSSVRWIAARRLTPLGQRLEVAQRPARVRIAQRGQPLPAPLRG